VRLIFTIDHSACLFYTLIVACSVLSRACKRGKLHLSLVLPMACVKSIARPVVGVVASSFGDEAEGSEESTISA
jgi:hypothetical protein